MVIQLSIARKVKQGGDFLSQRPVLLLFEWIGSFPEADRM
jgi:hypothetical protein